MVKVSAYIPFYNNSETIIRAAESILSQTVPVDELFLIDDGSIDDTVQKTVGRKLKVHSQGRNLGRGAARMRAMIESRNEFVLCCDATNTLSSDFLQKALAWFSNEKVAAVFGDLTQPPPRNAVERWRGRHLFRNEPHPTLRHNASLITFGTLVRKSAVLKVGNYNPEYRRSEDGELGDRLLAAGYDVVFDPSLKIVSIANNTLGQVLERYWRWNANRNSTEMRFSDYIRNVGYSVKVMAMRDLAAYDPFAVPISLICPHAALWHSWNERRQKVKLNGKLLKC